MSPFGGTLGGGPGGFGGFGGFGDSFGRFVNRLFGRIFGGLRAMFSSLQRIEGVPSVNQLVLRSP
jgi:hypothetical protein